MMTAVAEERQIKILLVDDDEMIRKSAGAFLRKMGHEVIFATNGREGLERFEQDGADIVISDIMMPDVDGLDFLRSLKERDSDVEVILVTGYGDLETAVEALRQGAFDFFTKPVRLEELKAALEHTRRYQAIRREKDRIQARLESLTRSSDHDQPDIIGESDVMGQVAGLVEKVARTERTTVLIRGESGTGKELVARAIHRSSERANAAFISINCTAVPDGLFESELFGHEKGSFTDATQSRKGMFELSHGGTLFLDEVGDMSPASQAKILRALEERVIRRVGGVEEIPVDVRLVAATNQDLDELLSNGTFRQDLFFRLNVFTIDLPPLRERGDDVLLLAYHYLGRYAREFRKDISSIDKEATRLLRGYEFPGNVRELRNLVERAVILADGPSLTVSELADLQTTAVTADPGSDSDEQLTLVQFERRAIVQALASSGGNQTEAARRLGIGTDALRYRLKKHNL
jgi:DNA-binding NtrC family response regulator